MAKCEVCGKSVQFGHNVSHSNKKNAKDVEAQYKAPESDGERTHVAQIRVHSLHPLRSGHQGRLREGAPRQDVVP
jgi:hypothetical protein